MARPGCKLVTRFSYEPSRHVYYVSGRSQTVPDMNYSIRTLLDRYQRNPIPVDMSSKCEYDEQIDTEVLRNNFDDEKFDTIFPSGHAPDLTDISDARNELLALKKAERSKRMARTLPRKSSQDPQSGIEDPKSGEPASHVGDSEQVKK